MGLSCPAVGDRGPDGASAVGRAPAAGAEVRLAAECFEPAVRVVGCGRSHRRDDQVGLRVAERLDRVRLPGTQVATTHSPGVELLVGLEGIRLLVIIDAARAARASGVGRLTRIEYGAASIAPAGWRLVSATSDRASSAHLLGVPHALELGRTLGLLPPEVWIYAIAGRDFGYGHQLSAELEARLDSYACGIAADIAAWRRRTRRDHGAPRSRKGAGRHA